MIDTLVIGAGPAGVLAALRAADLGARTMLVTRAEFGGMAANDGPVPVRTLAHAARLIRQARQPGQYGIALREPRLDYARLLRARRQGASIFNAYGSRIQLFQTAPRILPSEDEDVSAAVSAAFRESGIVVHENFGAIESFEKTPTGVRMIFSKNGDRDSAEATLAVVAVGWVAGTERLSLATASVQIAQLGFVKVDGYLRTSTPHIFAAGDITGRQMLVPQAIQDGFVAATNAVRGPTITTGDPVSPVGSFTDPEYAQVGLTEAKARETHDVVTPVVTFDSTTR